MTRGRGEATSHRQAFKDHRSRGGASRVKRQEWLGLMTIRRDLHQQNRLSWNAATAAHTSHRGDEVAFFREGGSTLQQEERDLLGDVGGLSLVHLQCNGGRDSLSLAALGANVTGVDISDTAIDHARWLSDESGIPARFYRADVYDWLAKMAAGGERFDVAFCSYGALCWLSDLASWARGVHAMLKPGGRFVTVEFHPVMMMFDEADWSLRYPYSFFGTGEYLTIAQGVDDYVATEQRSAAPDAPIAGEQAFRNPHPVFEFQWGLSDVVTALLDAGFRLDRLREYPYSIAAIFQRMREVAPGRWAPPEPLPAMPLLYGIIATRSA
jgi:SAM-dependent methyltransferase